MSESNCVGRREKYGFQVEVRRYSYIMLRIRGVHPPSSAHSSAGRREGSAEVEVVRRMDRGIENKTVSGCA
jgi:hypothetical protein